MHSKTAFIMFLAADPGRLNECHSRRIYKVDISISSQVSCNVFVAVDRKANLWNIIDVIKHFRDTFLARRVSFSIGCNLDYSRTTVTRAKATSCKDHIGHNLAENSFYPVVALVHSQIWRRWPEICVQNFWATAGFLWKGANTLSDNLSFDFKAYLGSF